MAGRGAQSFKKRQKEQQRKEWQQEKLAKRLQKKHEIQNGPKEEDSDLGVPTAGEATDPAPASESNPT